jgi:hypothetical protein
MKYLCLIYDEEKKLNSMSKEEGEAMLGEFAETQEQLGGYYLIEAKDLNDAIQVAAKIPSSRIGSIEVRPIMSFDA